MALFLLFTVNPIMQNLQWAVMFPELHARGYLLTFANDGQTCYTGVMKKIISFDLDGTLVHGKYGDLVWNKGVPEEYSLKYGLPFEEARQRVRAQYEAIGDTNVEWYDINYWLAKFALPVPAKTLLDRFESFIEAFPDTAEVLKTLAERYTLVVASNAARIFVEKELSHTHLEMYFAHVISATSDYGMVKKEDGFYGRLCRTLSASPQDMVHVGDHYTFDFLAPTQCGIDAYHVVYDHSPSNASSPDTNGKTIRSLSELLHKL
mgnify:CR=1 FL=1